MVKPKKIIEEVLWEKEVYGHSGAKLPPKLKLTKEEKEQKKLIIEIIDILMEVNQLKEWWDYDD